MKLFIPQRINVGFQEREGTYTGKLAYIIYFDEKGVLRKEKSWQSWRNKDIDPIQFDNKPMDGFVLNKGVGGARQSYGWNARNEYIRIYDPRDFEFEISVENLLFILRENDCMKGKGLTGQYIYGWNGTELVLLPTNCEDYKESINFTNAKSNKMSLRDLKAGYTYRLKDLSVITYIGKHKYYDNSLIWYYNRQSIKYGEVCHIIYDESKESFSVLKNPKYLSEEIEESGEYANLVDKYYNSIYADIPDTFLVDGIAARVCEVLYYDHPCERNHTYDRISYTLISIDGNKIHSRYEDMQYDNDPYKLGVMDRIRENKDKIKLRLKNGKIFSIKKADIEEYCDE